MSSNSPIKNYALQLLRAIVAAGTIILCSQYLGSAGRGLLGLLLFYVSLINTASEFVGGSSLANLIVKYSLKKLIPFSYLWAVAVNILGGLILCLLLPLQQVGLIVFLGIPLSLLSVKFALYQGLSKSNERAKLQLVFEILKLVFVSIYLVFLLNNQMEGVAVCLLIFAVVATLIFIYSFYKLKTFQNFKLKELFQFPKELITTGFWSQMGHLAQLFNYRLGLLFLAHLVHNEAAAGVYSNILLVADTIWIFANSFGGIAHMRIIQSNNTRFIADITMRYSAISFICTFIITGIVLLIPAQFYSFIFGKDFSELKLGLLFFCIGILALSLTSSLSNYFHGTNRFKYLFFANSLGMVIQFILGYFLVPIYGLNGASIAASAGFVAIYLTLYLQFKNQNPVAHYQWLSAFRGIKGIVKRVLN